MAQRGARRAGARPRAQAAAASPTALRNRPRDGPPHRPPDPRRTARRRRPDPTPPPARQRAASASGPEPRPPTRTAPRPPPGQASPGAPAANRPPPARAARIASTAAPASRTARSSPASHRLSSARNATVCRSATRPPSSPPGGNHQPSGPGAGTGRRPVQERKRPREPTMGLDSPQSHARAPKGLAGAIRGGRTMSTFVYSAPVPLACQASAVTAPPKTAGPCSSDWGVRRESGPPFGVPRRRGVSAWGSRGGRLAFIKMAAPWGGRSVSSLPHRVADRFPVSVGIVARRAPGRTTAKPGSGPSDNLRFS